jgi:hypothetical protein
MTATATAPAARFSTREEWLVAAIESLRPIFDEVGEQIPAVKVSVGWPGGNGRKNSVIGQCWHKDASADKVAQIFVSPVLDDAVRVLDVLAHEVVHAIDENASGHRGRFAKIAKAIGLTGKMTATVAGDDLKARLEAIVEDLGAFPHGALAKPGDGAAEGPKKQGTRMLKAECAQGSGYKVRLTRQWLDEYGAPICPCHQEQMIEG